jgi:hypothetical protein
MFPMRSAIGLCAIFLGRLGFVLALVSCSSQATNADRGENAAVAEMPRPAIQPIHPSLPSDPRSALAAIRAEWTACREKAFGPLPLQECDDRASAASGALLPRSRTTPRQLQDLEADLFEPLVHVSAMRGDDVMGAQVSVIYSAAELAQRRAAILTGVSGAPLAHEQVRFSVADLLRRLDGTMDAEYRRLLAPEGAQSWLRRWVVIRNQDCSAYPVPRCAALLDGAFGGMLYDNLSDGGERHLPPLRR